jgi:flagellar hook-basal body complex protein FliE
MKSGLKRFGWQVALLAWSTCLIGCHQSEGPTGQGQGPIIPSAPAGDPEAISYKKLRSADVQVDSAIQELNDSLQKAESLAKRAGGDATKALLSVVEQLNQAGESLGDYENSPDTLEEFKKDFNNQDERRLRSIKLVLDAIGKINDAVNVLNDLNQNVPEGFKKDLGDIMQGVNETQTDLEQAVKSMGGQIPDDGVSESMDPAQDKPDSGQPKKGK